LGNTFGQLLARNNYGIKTTANWTTAKREIANGQLPARLNSSICHVTSWSLKPN